MRQNPFKNLSIALPGREFCQKGFRIETKVPDQMLISGRIVAVFAIFLGNGGSSLVAHSRQDRQAAKAHARAAGRTKSEIGGGNGSAHFGIWRLGDLATWITSCTFC